MIDDSNLHQTISNVTTLKDYPPRYIHLLSLLLIWHHHFSKFFSLRAHVEIYQICLKSQTGMPIFSCYFAQYQTEKHYLFNQIEGSKWNLMKYVSKRIHNFAWTFDTCQEWEAFRHKSRYLLENWFVFQTIPFD